MYCQISTMMKYLRKCPVKIKTTINWQNQKYDKANNVFSLAAIKL